MNTRSCSAVRADRCGFQTAQNEHVEDGLVCFVRSRLAAVSPMRKLDTRLTSNIAAPLRAYMTIRNEGSARPVSPQVSNRASIARHRRRRTLESGHRITQGGRCERESTLHSMPDPSLRTGACTPPLNRRERCDEGDFEERKSDVEGR